MFREEQAAVVGVRLKLRNVLEKHGASEGLQREWLASSSLLRPSEVDGGNAPLHGSPRTQVKNRRSVLPTMLASTGEPLRGEP